MASSLVCGLPISCSVASTRNSLASLSSAQSVFSSPQLLLSKSGSIRIERKQRRFALRIDANIDLLGDFGGRDPTAAEKESNFGDKVIGNYGTEHIILIPPSLLGLSERSCTPLEPGSAPLSEEEAKPLLRKVVGWRLAKTDKGHKIWTEWKLTDFESGIKLFGRIAAVAKAEGHYPELHLEAGSIARAELSTQSIGGLSMNDFIFAAKIDKVKTKDLVKKTRFWA